jgi:hypothetical protein
MDKNNLKKFIESTKANVDKYGVSIMGVIGSHAYTIGMAKIGLPDVIITGSLNQDTAQIILNDLFKEWKEKGVGYGDNYNLITGKDSESLKCHVRAIAPSEELYNEYVCQALNFYSKHPEYATTDSPMFAQILWPDTQGKLPTEKGYLHDEFKQPIFNGLS